VYEFTDLETGLILAAKVVEKSSLKKTRAKQKLMSEIKIHSSLIHDHICKFKKYFEDKDNVYIVLELCPNSSMNDMVKRRKRLTEMEAKCYINQLINASQYMHSQNIIHRDLKLGNLFLGDEMKLKVGDFGLATKVSFKGEK
jgi:polo-like kinase 1